MTLYIHTIHVGMSYICEPLWTTYEHFYPHKTPKLIPRNKYLGGEICLLSLKLLKIVKFSTCKSGRLQNSLFLPANKCVLI